MVPPAGRGVGVCLVPPFHPSSDGLPRVGTGWIAQEEDLKWPCHEKVFD